MAERTAFAVLEFVHGPLLENPRRLGGELHDELAGRRSARVGSYRIVYRVDEDSRTVTVTRIEHRADVYRPR